MGSGRRVLGAFHVLGTGFGVRRARTLNAERTQNPAP